MKMVSPSFSWPTADPHKTSKVFPKALPSLQACVSVFLDEKAVFQSIPSIWQTLLCSLAGWLALRILIALPSASGSWVGDEAWFLPNDKGDEFGAESPITAWPQGLANWRGHFSVGMSSSLRNELAEISDFSLRTPRR